MRLLVILLAIAAGGESRYLEPLALWLSAPKQTILVGEPAKVVLMWSATRPIEVTKGSVRILLDDGTGFRTWGETAFGATSSVELPQRLAPGKAEKTAHVVAVTGYMDTAGNGHFKLAFPRPGRYQIRAQYGPDVDGVTSNTATVTVVMPKGKEAELLERHIRPHPEILTGWSKLLDNERIEQLFDEYPGSPYLARSKLLLWERQIEEAIASGATEEQRRGAIPLDGEAARLVDRLANDDLEGSPFDEDRLLLLAETKSRWGRREEGLEVYKEIIAKYPGGDAASKAQRRLADAVNDQKK
jgi:hypothetical protein